MMQVHQHEGARIPHIAAEPHIAALRNCPGRQDRERLTKINRAWAYAAVSMPAILQHLADLGNGRHARKPPTRRSAAACVINRDPGDHAPLGRGVRGRPSSGRSRGGHVRAAAVPLQLPRLRAALTFVSAATPGYLEPRDGPSA